MANHEVFQREPYPTTPNTNTAKNQTQDTVSLQYVVSF